MKSLFFFPDQSSHHYERSFLIVSLCHVASIPLSLLWQGKRCIINLQIREVDLIFVQKRSWTAEGIVWAWPCWRWDLCSQAGQESSLSIPLPSVMLRVGGHGWGWFSCVPLSVHTPSVGPSLLPDRKETEQNKSGARWGRGEVCKCLWILASWLSQVKASLKLPPFTASFWRFDFTFLSLSSIKIITILMQNALKRERRKTQTLSRLICSQKDA